MSPKSAPVLSSQLLRFFHSTRRGLWLSVALWLISVSPALAEALDLRVAIEENAPQVVVGSSTDAIVRDGSGKQVGTISGGNAFIAKADSGKVAMDRWKAGQLWIEPKNGGYVYITQTPGSMSYYRGKAVVVPTEKGLTAVNYVGLEQYLYSVLGSEMHKNAPMEALKAQAVAARSYALFQRQSSANGVFDVGDTQSWQVYKGVNEETTTTQAAVNATQGQVLTYNGQIIEAVFHSSAGGCTENVEDVWVQALPYLRSVKDFDEGTPNYQWTETVSVGDLSKKISGVGTVKKLTVEGSTTTCGRVKKVRVEGDAGTKVISGEALRSALGLKSTLFTFEQVAEPGKTESGKAKAATTAFFRFNGRGFGHGLGLSQYGAYVLAQQGATYQQILSHYYKNTTLARIQVR